MGDILLAVPTARKIAANGNKVHWVIHERWKKLTQFLPAEIHHYSGSNSLFPLIKEIRKLKPVKLHDLQGKIASKIISSLSACPTTSYKKRSLSEQLKALTGQYPLSDATPMPVWQRYLKTAGYETDNPDPSLVISDEYIAECEEVIEKFGLRKNEFILLHPGASKPGKVMPFECVAALQEKLDKELVLVGTDNLRLEGKFKGDIRNKIDLFHLPGVISLAKAIITTDSGPMHLARAVNTKLAAIFFQTSPSLGFSPIPGKNAMVISKELPCKPCSLHGQRENCPEGHFNCRNLNWKETVKKIIQFMENQS